MLPFLSQVASLLLVMGSCLMVGTTPAVAVAARRAAMVMVLKSMMKGCCMRGD